MTDRFNYQSAVDDFRRERNQAALQVIMGKITGKPFELLSFDDISRNLRIQGGSDKGLKDIPIKAIVGSVSRYTDFTRTFLPLHDSDFGRWAGVKTAISGSYGVPPIEVYKVGEAYFVKDGHHRVSVARSIGAKYIQAHVIEIQTKVSLTPDVSPEELILKSEYADFLEKTRIDEILPDADLRLTVPGSYQRLLEHIQVHQYFMGLDEKREITQKEAILHWYQELYLPVQKAIADRGILREFPGRTETDLYLWISDHHYLLEKEMGWHIRPEAAAVDLARRNSPRTVRILQRLFNRLVEWIVPNTLVEAPPAPGQWRREIAGHEECLFSDILVPLSGSDESWNALEQAITFSHCDGANIQGLHIAGEKSEPDSELTETIRKIFTERCEQADIQGGLAVTSGDISKQICDWARFSDLVVLNVAHPPADQWISRLSSGLRTIISQCPRPILAVPGRVTEIKRLLLSFDGSPRSKEALYVSAYLAGRWQIPLIVLNVVDENTRKEKPLNQAKKYLEEARIQATYLTDQGDVGECILKTVGQYSCDLILMGGYGFSPMVELMMGSTVDQVLRSTQIPVLICQ